jgi:surfactin synthase thioesterase subunit
MEVIKLFCLPYAGGSAMMYNQWKQYLRPGIQLVPIELAGRGKRIHEGLYDNIGEAVEDVFAIIKPTIGHGSYALYGHSMGALIAYELAQKIGAMGFGLPLHIFLSGRGAPHIKRADEKMYHLMDNEGFKKEVVELGGTPPDFFHHPELLELFMPMLKNDFRITETILSGGNIEPLDCALTVFSGITDDLTAAQCEEWKLHTKRGFHLHYFNGGHFFIHDAGAQVVQLINKLLWR